LSEAWFSSIVGRDMAVDLGTANTLVYVRGRGIVLNEPSVVAINTKDGRPLAVGAEAKRMIGRTPEHITAIRPLKDGVIADFDVCEKMLRYFIQRVHQRRWTKPRMVICSTGVTGCGAVGRCRMPPSTRGPQPPTSSRSRWRRHRACCPCTSRREHGRRHRGGTCEVAVISLGGIVASESIRIGGDELDEAIITYVKKEYSLALGERTAEEIKMALGSAFPLEEELYAEVRGRDLVTGLPKTIMVSTQEIRDAIEEPVSAIVDAVKVTLDKRPRAGGDIKGEGDRHHRGAPAARSRRALARRGHADHRGENALYSARSAQAVPRGVRRPQAGPISSQGD